MIEILVYPVDEVKKELDGLMDNFKEMELQKDKEMERLKKEREWLIANWAKDKHYINNLWAADQLSMDEHKEKILDKMQQALKGK